METSPSITDIAWAAGLFEGEGCLNVFQRSSGKWQTQARLRMADRDVVERFAAIVGFGTVRGPIAPQEAHWSPTWEWYTQRRDTCRSLIALFLPYFGERRTAKAHELLALGEARPLNERTHCPKGHPLSGDNLQTEPFVGTNGKSYVARRCKTCRQAQARDRKRRELGITPDRFRV